ncbi:hypothetical protein EBT31_02695 [bacterium]|nr:hypothetical protein [bacterium]
MYTPDGRTLRQVFRTMSPKKNDMDQSKSELLAYIMSQLNCDMAAAVRAFNSMRNHNSKVLIFDPIERLWFGCDWAPENKEAKEEFLLREMRRLDRRLNEFVAFVKDMDYRLQKKSTIESEFRELKKHYTWFSERHSDDVLEIQTKIGITPLPFDFDSKPDEEDIPAPTENLDPRHVFGPEKKRPSFGKSLGRKKFKKSFWTKR